MSGSRRASRPYPSTAFADISGLHALLDRTDANHARAARLFRSLSAARARLVLTNFIRAEAHALILNRLGHAAATRFLSSLRGMPPETIVCVTETDEARALDVIERYQEKDFSLTDATSFAVMERLEIGHAFSYDDDFRQYAWILLTDA